MRHDVIPPLSDCVQLSVDQYRAKLYDIIRAEKAGRRLKQESNEKLAERRASSHELREKTSIGERNHGDHLRGEGLQVGRGRALLHHSDLGCRGQQHQRLCPFFLPF